MKTLGIIPARYASTRFPGKPLIEINGKPMVQRVYEQAKKCKSLTDVVVATDDERIHNCVKAFGGTTVLTSSSHPSGTDRCAEALDKIGSTKYDVVINIQGDEPYIQPEQIEELVACFKDPKAEIATLVKRIINNETLFNPNIPKVIVGENNEALYFSRSAIPHIRNTHENEWLTKYAFYKHIGIYGYRSDVLPKLTKLKPSVLEQAEMLEQLRWLENGYRIKVNITEHESIAIDIPEDLEKITGM